MNSIKKNKSAAQKQNNDSRPQTNRQPAGWGLPFVLALFMHAILFVGLFFVFQWNTESTDVVYAELWSPAQMSSATPAPKEEVKTEPVKAEPQKEPEEKPEPQEKPEP